MSAPTPVNPPPTCPTCPAASRVCPTSCQEGYSCRLSVIESTCQCPVASCVKFDFNTGTGDSGNKNNGKGDPSGPSIVGPVVGSFVAIIVVILVALFVLRRRRQRRRQQEIMLEQDDSVDSFKRWNSSSGDFSGNKDVIRIAYIPSMISESPITIPEPTTQPGTVQRTPLSSLQAQDRNKHDSVASIVDEAVVMGVSTTATPQVMKLNTIKATQSDLIQRSNTLHSSNSIKRSNSKRLLDTKAKSSGNGHSRSNTKNPSPLGSSTGDRSDSDSDQEDMTSMSQATRTRRPSAGSTTIHSVGSHDDNPFMSKDELSSSPGTPETPGTSRKLSSRSSNPFLLPSEPISVSTSRPSSTFSYSPSTSSPSSLYASIPIALVPSDPNSPISDLPEVNLRPWASGGPSSALRDSTFSTMSDSRSSTRGDGEEIMIFWGGQHRDSKASNM